MKFVKYTVVALLSTLVCSNPSFAKGKGGGKNSGASKPSPKAEKIQERTADKATSVLDGTLYVPKQTPEMKQLAKPTENKVKSVLSK